MTDVKNMKCRNDADDLWTAPSEYRDEQTSDIKTNVFCFSRFLLDI